MKTVEVRPEHLEQIALKRPEGNPDTFNDWVSGLVANIARGYAKTFMMDDHIIAIAGVTPLWGKVGEAWIMSSIHASPHAVALALSAKRMFAQIEEELGYDRIQAAVDVSDGGTRKWLEKMGFIVESYPKKYLLNGRDAVMLVRIKDGS